MSKHTPWPWKLRPEMVHFDETDHEAVYIEPTVWDSEEQHHIAVIRVGLEESDANARLIVAAPSNPHDCGDMECPGYREWLIYKNSKELLEALRGALPLIVGTYCYCPGRENHQADCRAKALDDAIAKAEGQS